MVSFGPDFMVIVRSRFSIWPMIGKSATALVVAAGLEGAVGWVWVGVGDFCWEKSKPVPAPNAAQPHNSLILIFICPPDSSAAQYLDGNRMRGVHSVGRASP